MDSVLVQKLLAASALGSEWVLWLLIALSVMSVSVMIERALFYRKTSVGNFSLFCNTLGKYLNARDIESAVSLCRESKSLESKVALTALSYANMGVASVERMIGSRIAREKQGLERGLMILGTLGNNSPFIGLFGTVIGIIQAFHALSLNPSGGSAVVMTGISEALVTTAVGLVVAIPAVVAFNAFQRIVKQRMSNAEAVQELVLSFYLREDAPMLRKVS